MSEAPKTVWVTKYALTNGILMRVEPTEICEGIAYAGSGPEGTQDYFLADDWHPTREAALARANEMKAAKIASLKRQIAKLEALTF